MKYDDYKSNIHYSFTEYKIDYRMRLEIEKETNLLNTGKFYVRELVRDNIESLMVFKLRKLNDESSAPNI